jgi:hypothetical protein
MLDNAALKDLLGRTAEACGAKGSAEKVDGTPWAEPTPCVRLMGWDRATMRYQRRRPDDTALRQRLCELAAQRRRFDYRRLGWLLAREGRRLNHKVQRWHQPE